MSDDTTTTDAIAEDSNIDIIEFDEDFDDLDDEDDEDSEEVAE
jgi:hypothetical protein